MGRLLRSILFFALLINSLLLVRAQDAEIQPESIQISQEQLQKLIAEHPELAAQLAAQQAGEQGLNIPVQYGEASEEGYEEEEEPAAPAQPALPSAAFVSTAFVFPQSAEKNFVPGEAVEVLIGFANNAPADGPIYNVTRVSASLMWPEDFRYYLQNFTAQAVGVQVAPGEQVTVAYTFRLDPLIEARAFGLLGVALYSDNERSNYSSIFLNTTFNVIEPESALDAQTLFTYTLFGTVLALFGYIGYNSFRGKKGKKTRATGRRIETGTESKEEIENDWLVGTAADKSRQSPSGYRKGGGRKK